MARNQTAVLRDVVKVTMMENKATTSESDQQSLLLSLRNHFYTC